MSRFPWKNTSEDIAQNTSSQYETPGGAQYKADKALNDANEYTNEITSQQQNWINHIIRNSGDSIIELVDARVSDTEEVYETLKDRLDTEHKQVIANLEERATKSEMISAVSQKADKTEVDSLDIRKADKTEVNSLAIGKADKTYVDTLTQSLASGSPKGIYATLSALQAAFPTGNTNIYVVTADGKWYYWSGSAWTAGGTYQSTGIADNSVTYSKRTKLGLVGYIIPAQVDLTMADIPDYNTDTKTLDFKSVAGKNPLIVWGSENYVIPPGTVVSLVPTSNSSTFKLFFNTIDKSFKVVDFAGDDLSEEYILIASGRNNTGIMSISCPYTINGKTFIADNSVTSKKRTALGSSVYVLPPFSGKLPNLDTINKTLTFYSDTSFFWNGSSINNGGTDTVIDLTTATSSAKKLCLHTGTREFVLGNFDMVIGENMLLVAVIRFYIHPVTNATIAYMSISCPYTIDGKGDISDVQHDITNIKSDIIDIKSVVINEIDAIGLYEFTVGSISGGPPPVLVNYQNRFRSTYILLKKGDVVTCNDLSTYKFGGHIYSVVDKSWIRDIGWQVGSFIADQDCYYRMVGGLVTDEDVTSDDIAAFVSTLSLKRVGVASGENSLINPIDPSEDISYSTSRYVINTDNSVTLDDTTSGINYASISKSSGNAHHMIVELEAKLTNATKKATINLYRGSTQVLSISINTTHYKPYVLKIPFDTTGVFTVRIGNQEGAAITGCQFKNVVIKLEEFPVKQDMDDNLLYVAHRGDTIFAPENTMPAFVSAYNKGYSAIETDVKVTSDGEFVLIHDTTINRTSNGTGDVSSLTLNQLRAYDFGSWKGSKYKDTPIVTLTEFLQWCRSVKIRPVLELKTSFTPEIAENFVNTIKQVNMWDKCDIISFNMSDLQAVANVDNTARFAHIGIPTQALINTLKSLGDNVYYSIYGGDLDAPVALCKSNSIEYISSTNDGNTIRRSNELGCFGVCTDMLNLTGCMY